MTRAEVLAQYRPIRAGIRRVLRLAPTACNGADLTRAAKHIAVWEEAEELKSGRGLEMLVDVGLFEPNQRGRRAYDRFLERKADTLDAADRALAQSIATAWFSIFRIAQRHELAGLWLEDLLDQDRRLWLVDKGLEASATEGMVIGMRLFDAGPFHAGFGIVVTPDQTTTDIAVSARAGGNRLPFRQSLAATLYGDDLRIEPPHDLVAIPLFEDLLEALLLIKSEHDAAPPGKAVQRARPRKSTKPGLSG